MPTIGNGLRSLLIWLPFVRSVTEPPPKCARSQMTESSNGSHHVRRAKLHSSIGTQRVPWHVLTGLFGRSKSEPPSPELVPENPINCAGSARSRGAAGTPDVRSRPIRRLASRNPDVRSRPIRRLASRKDGWCGRPGSNRDGSCLPRDFKSLASTSSATSAAGLGKPRRPRWQAARPATHRRNRRKLGLVLS